MEKVIGYLSEAYMEENRNVKVAYNPTGSGSGIQAVSDGRCDIGLSSRELKDDEKATLTSTVVAIDGIAIIVNPKNTVSDLSIEQIGKIYTGEISNWKDVGGEDSPIVLIGREAASGTRDGFEAITGTEDNCKYSQELTSTGDVVQTVSNNPNAIGYASLASVKDSVKTVTVDGVLPSTETIQNGSYKIQRNFVLVTKTDAPLSDAAQDFYNFATSEAADELIVNAGEVPVKH
jgi:phosphate transport system substrate-binding protein